tara:strand:- start:787 stop:918 length:132 start_codon:yes stop_codon:yes gene_type:complete
MNHWAFITAAYVITLAGAAALALQSWHAMRRAEAAAEALRKKR